MHDVPAQPVDVAQLIQNVVETAMIDAVVARDIGMNAFQKVALLKNPQLQQSGVPPLPPSVFRPRLTAQAGARHSPDSPLSG